MRIMLRRKSLHLYHQYNNSSFLLLIQSRRRQQQQEQWQQQGCNTFKVRCLSSFRSSSSSSSSSADKNWSVQSETGIVSYKDEPKFQTIIGLEIHAQLDIPTKLFSSAPASSATALHQTTTAPPNTSIRPFDLAVPGMLPFCSKAAVQAAILSAAALNCELATVSRFERKHYHYADLPFGYQVTQQRWPIARNGSISSSVAPTKRNKKSSKQAAAVSNNNNSTVVGIDRIQLEQDTGKTTTSTSLASEDGRPIQRSNVDFNRAGCSLIEIVMNPDIRSSIQAAQTVETLRQLLKHIGTCNGRMEEGSLRVDLNVSIQPIIENSSSSIIIMKEDTNRVEVKNLNSLRQVQQAAEYEAIRQAQILAEDETTRFRETRTFHVKSGKTVLIRTKEGEEDYRFMPEPDLPPIVLNKEVLDGKTLEDFLHENLAELPEAARERLRKDYKLDEYTASVISGDPPAIKLYDDAVETALLELDNILQQHSDDENNKQQNSKSVVAKAVAKVLCNDLFALIREDEERRRQVEGETTTTTAADVYCNVSGQQLGELVAIQEGGIISTTQAKKLLTILYHHREDDDDDDQVGLRRSSPKEVAKQLGLQLITDTKELQRLCHLTIDNFPKQLEQYKKGGKYVTKMKKFFAGKMMAESKGNAHPERMHEALDEVLEELAPGVTTATTEI